MKISATAPVLLALLTFSVANAQVVRPLPPPTASGRTFGQFINASGVAVGYTGSNIVYRPAIWRPSGSTYVYEALPLPPGNVDGVANSIGAGGVIAGYSQPNDQSTATATVWTAPPAGAYAATLLPSPLDSTLTSAYAINATGSVGGFRETATGHTDAVVWEPLGPAYSATMLPALSGWVDTAATAINDNGDLAGYSFAALGGPRGAVWKKTPSGYVAKDVIAAADDVVITAINNFGIGAGVLDGDQAAVMVEFEGEYYAGELSTPFDTSSAANAVNNADALVGYVKQGSFAAALWLPGDDEWELVNLDDWLNRTNPSLGNQWVLEEATGITDNWLVTGQGFFGATRVPRGFVLDVSSLVPEPSGVFALIGGPLLILRRRRRRS